MRRFSQRNPLVTLSDINITPLLDLAFVLLIIFVITTPLLEQGLSLKLPAGDIPDKEKIDPRDIRTVEVNPYGQYMMNKQWQTLEQISGALIGEYRRNPKLLVYIRADETGPFKHVAAILYQLERGGVSQVSIRTTPTR
jgi:biopolymer transport protein ExbD